MLPQKFNQSWLKDDETIKGKLEYIMGLFCKMLLAKALLDITLCDLGYLLWLDWIPT